jgi:LPS-assembly lipoprotein
MKSSTLRHFILFALLAVSLAGCGFQLKQSSTLPASFGPVSIDGISKFSTFYKTVRNTLRQSSIKIVEAGESNHTIHITPSRERKVLSVNTRGKVSEYELIQRVTYRVTSTGSTLVAPTTLSRTTFYTVSNSEVLSDTTEEEDIYDRLEQQLVNQMFDQISAAL